MVSPSRLLYLYHFISFPTAAQLIAARSAAKKISGVGHRSVGNSLFRRRVRRPFPYFGAARRYACKPAPSVPTSQPPPTRRVRDAVGPSPAAARVERCVYITNPLMVRPNGSPASAIARQRGFQLPLLIKMFSNQSCGNKHMDMLNLLLG